MSVLPDTKIGKVQFCEGHIAVWTTNATAIGTTTTAVTDLGTKTTAGGASRAADSAAGGQGCDE